MRKYRILMRHAIRSKRVVMPEGRRAATIVIEDESILAVDGPGIELGSMPVLDVENLWVLPGLVDSHVHINDPGRSEWEGFATASRAAAAGGYTCLVDMPLNCVPSTTDVPALERKREAAAARSVVDYAFWGGVVPGNAGDLLPLAQAGVKGFKSFLTDPGIAGFTMVDEHDLRSAMPLIAQTGLPLLVHAEDQAIIARFRPSPDGNPRQYGTYLHTRPPEAEVAAIELMIGLSREYRCRVHIVHLSSAVGVPALRRARQEGLPITVETCPHYLHFTASEIPDGATQSKCAPPIRDESNRECLWDALREGVIDLIATDHSPCPPVLKRSQDGDFLQAWGGIASLSLALPVIWQAASSRGFAITDVVRWMAHNTANRAGIGSEKGRIAPGCNADFVVFDPDLSFVAQASDLYFRHPLSPYLGERLSGRVVMTFLRGACVFANGKFADECRGRECRVSEWSTVS